jgi:hypothetical protein
MRKVNVLEFVSLDGVIQASGGQEEDTTGSRARSLQTCLRRKPSLSQWQIWAWSFRRAWFRPTQEF